MRADDKTPRESNGSQQGPRAALDWPRATGRIDEFMAAIAVRQRRRRRRQFQAAVVCVAVLAAVGITWRTGSRLPQPVAAVPIAATAATPILAMPLRQVLDDGTVVELKDDAQIEAAFTAGIRRVVLRRGGAHFEVTKDSSRPFVVVAGNIEVRAVGTAFTVERRSEAVEIVVSEGRVAVEANSTMSGASVEGGATSTAHTFESERNLLAPVDVEAPVAPNALRTLAMLDAGKAVVVEVGASQGAPTAKARIFELSTSELDRRLAWRAPRLDLSRTRLSQAISLINEHSATALVLGDEELGELELSGVLRADNVEPLLRVLEQNYGVRTERLGATIILRGSR